MFIDVLGKEEMKEAFKSNRWYSCFTLTLSVVKRIGMMLLVTENLYARKGAFPRNPVTSLASLYGSCLWIGLVFPFWIARHTNVKNSLESGMMKFRMVREASFMNQVRKPCISDKVLVPCAERRGEELMRLGVPSMLGFVSPTYCPLSL